MPRIAQTPSLASSQPAPGGAAAVDRALTLLNAFNEGDEALSLTELAERTQLYKSTVLRLLASLEHAGLVQRRGSGSYALGREVARLNAIYAASFSLDQVVVPALRALVAITRESAAYHVIQGTARLCLYRVDSPQPIRDHIKAGDVLPMNRGTGGRVLTVFGDAPTSAHSTKDRQLYARIRAQGYFSTTGDRLAGVAGISAPVFRPDASLAAALTLTMPADRYDETHVQRVLAAARRLGEQLPQQ
ncbi:MAG: IclR family transcriptional regulator [Vitreoscilla sp.]|nr:IclR family transcriptional regulator [Polaromonas sp.]